MNRPLLAQAEVQKKSAASETDAAMTTTHQAPGESSAPTAKNKINALTPVIVLMVKMLASACDIIVGL